MGVRQKIFDAYRRQFGKWWINDPQPISLSAPYTFYLPPDDYLAAIDKGDIVKLVFEGKPISKEYGAERMWVIVTKREGDSFEGRLDNDPFDMPQIKSGELVRFTISDIIDIDWTESDLSRKGLRPVQSREYWDRCYVDDCVINDGVPVQYLYREAPDKIGDDQFPDSGWRFRGHRTQMTQEDYDNPKASYIAIGKVLNADDSWVHLIDSPMGSSYFKNDETGEFEPTTEN